jgi:hypothetical protein
VDDSLGEFRGCERAAVDVGPIANNHVGRCRTIRLGEHRAFGGSSGGLSTLASIPFFLIGVASTGWAWATEKFPALDNLFSGGRPYRHVPIDDDGQSARDITITFAYLIFLLSSTLQPKS